MRTVLLLAFLAFSCRPGVPSAEHPDPATYLEPDEATGTSLAVVVDESAPLAHTAQFLPLDAQGRLVGPGDTPRQIERVLENLRVALAGVHAGFDDLVKIHVYARSGAAAEAVRNRFAAVFTGEVKPAVSFVVGELPHPEAVVAMDAVAVVPAASAASGKVTHHHVASLYGAPRSGHVSVVPPGGKVYLSGQTQPGRMAESTRRVMEELHRTLDHLGGLGPADVFQVKAFLHPISEAAAVEEIVRSFYADHGVAPPFVAVEWYDDSYLDYLSLDERDGPVPIEIELHAFRQQGETAPAPREAVTYSAPPWMTAPATYSRVAEVHGGDLFYTSGFYGSPDKDAEGQTRDLFAALRRVLDAVGSDFDHLVKGTYYVTDRASSEQLNQIRTEFYDPKRAPTSSKMPVRSVGREGALITFDMIGVIPAPRPGPSAPPRQERGETK